MSETKIHAQHGPDYWLFFSVVALLILGAMMVFSASSALGYREYQRATFYLERQLIWILLGLIAMYVMSRIDYHFWQSWPISVTIIALTLVALIGTWLSNQGSDQARRWLFSKLFGADGSSVQPSEFAKLGIILYIAAWLASKGEKIRQLTYGLVPFSILLGVMTGLILIQPNLSTAALVAMTAMVMFFVAGADLMQLLILSVVGGALVLFEVIWKSEYQMARVMDFFSDPFADPSGQGYQSFHALMALVSGGLTGVGLGDSVHKVDFVWVPHTDVILAIIGEELGFLGILVIIGFFVAFAYRGIRIALRAPDSFGCILAVGVVAWISLQAIIHAAVVTKTIPFTGMPLPFISYGGSALIAEMAGVGLLLNISKHTIQESGLDHADTAFGRWNGWPRVPRAHHS